VLRRLPEFGVALLPAQLTALPDKQQLLHSVLLGRSSSSRRGMRSGAGGDAAGVGSGRVAVAPWRRLGDVLELAELLGMGGQEEQQQVRRHGFGMPWKRLGDVSELLQFSSTCLHDQDVLEVEEVTAACFPCTIRAITACNTGQITHTMYCYCTVQPGQCLQVYLLAAEAALMRASFASCSCCYCSDSYKCKASSVTCYVMPAGAAAGS
jgi:hypothetical protein